MKIKEVEERVGITSQNIRFYEKEGLLFPKRNSVNNYREYSDAEITRLKEIKVLRMMEIPVEQIKSYFEKRITLEELLNRQLVYLKNEQMRARQLEQICSFIKDKKERLGMNPDDLIRDAVFYMEQEERILREDRIRFRLRRRYWQFRTVVLCIICILGSAAAVSLYMQTSAIPWIGITITIVVLAMESMVIWQNEKRNK